MVARDIATHLQEL